MWTTKYNNNINYTLCYARALLHILSSTCVCVCVPASRHKLSSQSTFKRSCCLSSFRNFSSISSSVSYGKYDEEEEDEDFESKAFSKASANALCASIFITNSFKPSFTTTRSLAICLSCVSSFLFIASFAPISKLFNLSIRRPPLASSFRALSCASESSRLYLSASSQRMVFRMVRGGRWYWWRRWCITALVVESIIIIDRSIVLALSFLAKLEKSFPTHKKF